MIASWTAAIALAFWVGFSRHRHGATRSGWGAQFAVPSFVQHDEQAPERGKMARLRIAQAPDARRQEPIGSRSDAAPGVEIEHSGVQVAVAGPQTGPEQGSRTQSGVAGDQSSPTELARLKTRISLTLGLLDLQKDAADQASERADALARDLARAREELAAIKSAATLPQIAPAEDKETVSRERERADGLAPDLAGTRQEIERSKASAAAAEATATEHKLGARSRARQRCCPDP